MMRARSYDYVLLFQVFIGIPVVVLLAAIYLVIAPFYDYPMESFYCLLFIIMGIPIYFMFVKWNILPKWFLEFLGKYDLFVDTVPFHSHFS